MNATSNARTPGRRGAIDAARLLLALALVVVPGCGGDEHEGHTPPDPTDAHAEHGPGAAAGPGQEIHDQGDGVLRVRGELARRLGVVLAEARVEDLHRDVGATGEIVPDETRLATVSLRFSGWAETLHADFTGRFVREGEPLLEVYSPQLVSAQEDLLAALRLAEELSTSRVPGSVDRSRGAVEAARDRLDFWQVPGEVVRRLEETGQVQRRLVFEAPVSGFILEMGIQAGEYFQPGAPLYRLADLSRVWLEAEVYERDLAFVTLGTETMVSVPGQLGGELSGRVTFIHPVVDRERRTARVRIELPNPGGVLRPGMYATARLHALAARDALTVPRDAVLHTGRRAVVFVATGENEWEIREVEVGVEAGERTQILSGLEPGDRVAARAGFILDSESRLMEAMLGQPGMPGMEMEMEMPIEMEMEDPGAHDPTPPGEDSHEGHGGQERGGGHEDHDIPGGPDA